jgi:hypothetical protein
LAGWKDSNLLPDRYEGTSPAARKAYFSDLMEDLTERLIEALHWGELDALIVVRMDNCRA